MLGVPSFNFRCSLSFWCPGDCGPPPNLNFAFQMEKFNETSYKESTRLYYSCRPGFSKTSSRNYIKCENGDWRYDTFCVSKYEHLFSYLCFSPFFAKLSQELSFLNANKNAWSLRNHPVCQWLISIYTLPLCEKHKQANKQISKTEKLGAT